MSDLTLDQTTNPARTTNVKENAIVLSNLIELVGGVVLNIAGKDIADSINNASINRSVLNNLIANRVKQKILNKE